MNGAQPEPGHMRRWIKRVRKTVRTRINMPVKYATYMTGRSAGPIFPDPVYIESTNHCNLRCIMCPTGLGVSQRPKEYMEMGLYRRIIDEIGPMVGAAVLHSWGEPLMHPHLCDMIDYAKRANVTVETSTNITLLNEARARRVLEAGLDTLYLAMDGGTRETYERVRVNSKWDKVLRNVDGLLELKQRLGAATRVV